MTLGELTRLRCGERVCLASDPRHVGRVKAILWSRDVRIRWDDTGWISDEAHEEIEHAAAAERRQDAETTC